MYQIHKLIGKCWTVAKYILGFGYFCLVITNLRLAVIIGLFGIALYWINDGPFLGWIPMQKPPKEIDGELYSEWEFGDGYGESGDEVWY